MNMIQMEEDAGRLRRIYAIIQEREAKLDPDLQENARNERAAAIYKEFSEEISILEARLNEGIAYCQEQRAIWSDPFYSLAVACLGRSDTANQGHAIIASNVEFLPVEAAIKVLACDMHPCVVLALCNHLKAKMDEKGDPVQKRKIHGAIVDACDRFIDRAHLAKLANLELEPTRIMWEKRLSRSRDHKDAVSAIAKLDMARRLEHLKSLATGVKVRPNYDTLI